MREKAGARVAAQDLPVLDHRDVRGALFQIGRDVRRKQDAALTALHHAAKELHELVARHGVEPARRLVNKIG